MQEFRRDVEMAEKTSLPELEEEVAANVVKSKFLLAVEKKDEEEEGKNVQVPYVKKMCIRDSLRTTYRYFSTTFYVKRSCNY